MKESLALLVQDNAYKRSDLFLLKILKFVIKYYIIKLDILWLKDKNQRIHMLHIKVKN